ncbi:MAG: hypothetical protein ABII90_02665 [Bacteroidota bacterium]
MNNIIIISIFFCLNLFCAVSQAQYKISEPKYEYKVYSDKKIVLYSELRHLQIENGEKIVFEYYYHNGGNTANENEFIEKIVFEIDSNADSFEIQDNQIASHNGYYGRPCRCKDSGWHPISKGIINGKKLENNNWAIDFSIVAVGRDSKIKCPKRMNEEFILQYR